MSKEKIIYNDFDKIINDQYNFARWFDMLLLNTPFEKTEEAYRRAVHVIEEAIETMRCCDSRKSWKIEYTPTDESEVKEEIIDIFKFTLNWLIDLSTTKPEDEKDLPELVKKTISKILWTNVVNLTWLLEYAKSQFVKERIIYPTKNTLVKENWTIQIIRKIIKEASSIDTIEIWSSTTAINKKIQEDSEIYSRIIIQVLMLWLLWSTNTTNKDELEISENAFVAFFDSKSSKNINRQIVWTSEYKEHNA